MRRLGSVTAEPDEDQETRPPSALRPMPPRLDRSAQAGRAQDDLRHNLGRDILPRLTEEAGELAQAALALRVRSFSAASLNAAARRSITLSAVGH